MNKYMLEAIEEARKGITGGHGGPFGCVIVHEDKIIGRGHNQVVKLKDSTCHGEMMAIRDACKNIDSFDLSGSILYTTGQPCPMCFGAILWANISKVYYGCNIIDTEKIGFRDSAFYEFWENDDKKNEFIQELDRDECLKLYEEYESIKGKTMY